MGDARGLVHPRTMAGGRARKMRVIAKRHSIAGLYHSRGIRQARICNITEEQTHSIQTSTLPKIASWHGNVECKATLIQVRVQ